MNPIAVAALSLMTSVSNITDRAAAERTARLEKREAIQAYESNIAGIEQRRKHPDGDGLAREIHDMETATPRLKGMADIETKGLAETPEERRDVAFCDVLCPILALTDDEAISYISHLAKPGDDLAKTDKALFDKVSSNAFNDALAVAIARHGCSYTQYVFTYGTMRNVEKLRKAILRRIKALEQPKE